MISIHAPRTGSDVVQLKVVYRREKFQSTLPARGATLQRIHESFHFPISIHAPRTGSDADALSAWLGG